MPAFAAAQRGAPLGATPIIDVHMHIYPSREYGLRRKSTYQVWEYGEKPDTPFSRYGGDVADALEAIRRSPVDRAVVVNLFAVSIARANAIADLPPALDAAGRQHAIAEIDATMGERLKESNYVACDLARQHPELIAFVGADPWALDPEAGQAHLRDAVTNRGARGVKLHPVLQQFDASDPRMFPLYQTCVDLDIPIVAHSGPARSGAQFAEPRAFAGMLRAFPRLRVVLAHLGGGAWRQTAEVARAFPNAYFDCCEILAWIGASNAPDESQFARLIKEVGPERVLLGSDFPWYDLDYSVERIMGLPLLSRDEKTAILGGNAVQLLRL
jgi:predicted TIM-barrel fold metal-dependent hydrolase